MKAALQRWYFRNTTGEKQETGRSHSRTENYNKQVAAKKLSVLKGIPRMTLQPAAGGRGDEKKKTKEE